MPTAWIFLVAALAISLAYSCYYPSPTVDDPMIGYRYSERFLHGQGLTWNDGEYVEGYSNLLWLLLVAAGGLIQPNLLLVGWILGLLANAAVLVAIAWTFGRASVNSITPVGTGLLVLALSRSFAFWGTGGLETALLEALLAWALATTYRMSPGKWGWICPGLLLGLISITRPDGILLAAGLAVALVIRDGISRAALRRSLTLLIAPISFVIAQVSFRLYYYGQFSPNTAYAKIAFTSDRVLSGGYYVAQGMLENAVPLTLVVAFLVRLRRSQPQTIREAGLFLIPGLLWLGYIAVVGGDIFQFHRHWMPALVCLTFALSSLLTTLPSINPRRLIVPFVVTSVLYLASQRTVDPIFSQPLTKDVLANIESSDPEFFSHPLGSMQRVLQDCIALGQFFNAAFIRQQPLIAVKAAGCLPYASRLPSLDTFGLTDSYLAHHRPTDMGKGLLGVELGDAAYVLSRKPDLIEISYSNKEIAPFYRWEIQMALMPDFQKNYRKLYFRVGRVNGVFWARIEDGRLGVHRTANTIYIPGYLLSTTPDVPAVPDTAGRPAAQLEYDSTVFTNVYFPPGAWDVTIDADIPHSFKLSAAPVDDSIAAGSDTLRVISGGAPKPLYIFGGHGLVYAIRATRVAP